MTRRSLLFVVAALLVLGACAPPPLEAPAPRDAGAAASLPERAQDRPAPRGQLTVAYPDEPSTLVGPTGRDLARDDLAALWGLPLLRLDDSGQLRPGLVGDWEVLGDGPDGWQVRLEVAAGAWETGAPVRAEDVVATLTAAQQADPARFGAVTGAVVEGDDVVVTFDRPYASWADLLVEVGPVRPADALGGDDPVAGGWFRVAGREAGRSLRFEAHPDGPLGAPGVEAVEVLFTPSFETALGLLEDGDVDALVGYLPLNGVSRSTAIEGVEADAPFGGTTVALQFRTDGALGALDQADRRRGVLETVDVSELVEGLLGPTGVATRSPWPGAELDAPAAGEVREGQSLTLLFPRGSELLGFTARALQRDLVSRGMTVDLISEPAPRFAEVVDQERDVALVADRTPPRPSLGRWVDDAEVARAAGAAPVEAPDARAGLDAVGERARYGPLYRPGVLHAWRGVQGLRPSSWVGAGFWNAGDWRVAEDG